MNAALEEGTDIEENLKKLAGGRIDLFIITKEAGLYSIKLFGLKNDLTMYDNILFGKGYPMPFAKNSKYPELKKIADQYQQELIKMKSSGEYQKIVDKWTK